MPGLHRLNSQAWKKRRNTAPKPPNTGVIDDLSQNGYGGGGGGGCGGGGLLVVGCWLLVVGCCVVEWLYHSKRIIVVRLADLCDFFRDFRRKNVYFCFTSNEHCHFSSEKTITSQNGLLIFLAKETHSETISWNSSRILTKKLQQQR